jgi:hypothetical protein
MQPLKRYYTKCTTLQQLHDGTINLIVEVIYCVEEVRGSVTLTMNLSLK